MSHENDPADIGAARAAKDQASIDIPVGANAPTGKDEQNTVTEPTSGEPRDPGNPGPQSGNTPPQPGSGVPRPGNTPPQSGNGAPRPGNTPPQPGSGAPRPGNMPAQSGSGAPRPGSTPPLPGSGAPHPANTPPQPGSGVPRPGNTPAQSDSGVPRPGNTPAQSGSGAPRPGGTPPQSGVPLRPGNYAPQSGNMPPGGNASRPGNMAPQPGGNTPRPGSAPSQSGNAAPSQSGNASVGREAPRPGGVPPRGNVPPQISTSASGSGNTSPRPGNTPPQQGNPGPRPGNVPPQISTPGSGGTRPRVGGASGTDAATQAIPVGPQANTGTPRNSGGGPGGGNRPPAPRTVPQPGTPQPPAAPADATKPIATQSNTSDKTLFIDRSTARPGGESRPGPQSPSDETVVIDKSTAGARPGAGESQPGPRDTPAGAPQGSRAPESDASESPDQSTHVIPVPTQAGAVPPPTRIPPSDNGSGTPPGPRRRRGLWIAAAAAVVVVVAIVAIVLGTSGHGPGSLVAGPTTPPPPPAASISVPAAGGNPINPSVPIAVSVSGGHLTSVTATFKESDGSSKPLAGTIAPDRMSWTNTDSLAFGTAYTLVVDAVNNVGAHNQKTFTVNTMAAGRTAYANVVPAPDVVSNTGIGVGQPMVFQFTKPVANKAEVQKHLHVTVTPPQPGAWYWVDDKDVHYRGPTYWQPGTKIHIEADVVGVDLGNGVLGAENNSADYTVHDAMVAKADGSTDQLTIFQNGKQINQMPMSLGSPGFPSHEGPHVISDKQPSIVMDSCTYGTCQGQPGYYRETVALDERISNDGEFVHSAPWSVGQQGNSNVSHGCVNLAPANAQWFYDHFGIGDVVEITNSGGPTLPVWDTYGDWEVPWSTWQAGNATS